MSCADSSILNQILPVLKDKNCGLLFINLISNSVGLTSELSFKPSPSLSSFEGLDLNVHVSTSSYLRVIVLYTLLIVFFFNSVKSGIPSLSVSNFLSPSLGFLSSFTTEPFDNRIQYPPCVSLPILEINPFKLTEKSESKPAVIPCVSLTNLLY